jgi:hypothetical protein
MMENGGEKPPENQLMVSMFRIVVPALLGALITIAFNISSKQDSTTQAVAEINAKLAVVVSQSSDVIDRLSKAEGHIDASSKSIADHDKRLTVLEAEKRR